MERIAVHHDEKSCPSWGESLSTMGENMQFFARTKEEISHRHGSP